MLWEGQANIDSRRDLMVLAWPMLVLLLCIVLGIFLCKDSKLHSQTHHPTVMDIVQLGSMTFRSAATVRVDESWGHCYVT